MPGGEVASEIKSASFIVSVRRMGLPEKPKAGGFDAIVNGLIADGASMVFVELPLGRDDQCRVRVRNGVGLLREVKASSGQPLSQLATLLITLRHVMKMPRPRIWISADVSLAPVAHLLRSVGMIQIWCQHFPDYTPPRARFGNPLASFIYRKFVQKAWEGADVVTAPSERICEALSSEVRRQGENTIVISNQVLSGLVSYDVSIEHLICRCSRLHVLMATSSTESKFCINEAVQGAEQLGNVHLLVTGRVTDDFSAIADAKEPHVSFLGLLTDAEVRALARSCDFGLALYDSKADAHSNYGDSLKIRMYAAEGLPTIASAHVHPAAEVAAAGGARLVLQPNAWVDAVQHVSDYAQLHKQMSTASKIWATREEVHRRDQLVRLGDLVRSKTGISI